jgi:3-deoxy-D-manno-octulosonic-acid transferase
MAFMPGLSHTAYNLLVWLAQPLLRRKLARRAVAEPGYGVAVPERFGHYTQPAEAASELVWVHAVSLGESRAAGILIQALREALPGARILLTHGTATGRDEGQRLLRAGDVQVWQPWDTPAAVQRFLRHFRPRVGLLMETEVWPNLVLQSRTAGVPVALVNARMSEKSLQSALRWSSLMQPTYGALSAVWAQTEADAARLRTLSAQVQAVTGNLKFDAQPDAAQCAQAQTWRVGLQRPVLMLASSREGEEAQWLEALRAWPGALISVQWLIVPRHPQRWDEVQDLLVQAGLTVSRRSRWSAAGPQGEDLHADVWLGDSLGEMALYYSLADAALLGGSFAPLGGQNLIEAAACACPVFMGPHTFNFAEVAEQAEVEGAARRVPDMAQAVEQACMAVVDTAAMQEWRARALAFTQAHKGAARRMAGLVKDLLTL